MKKLVLSLSLLFVFNSCSVEDNQKFHYEILPVESVEMPSEFELGETYPIIIKYYKPTTCHGLNGFYFEKNLNIRTVAVQTVVFEDNTNCEQNTGELFEETMYFYVTNNGSYIFKFWQGTNEAGEDIFLDYEIPVN